MYRGIGWTYMLTAWKIGRSHANGDDSWLCVVERARARLARCVREVARIEHICRKISKPVAAAAAAALQPFFVRSFVRVRAVGWHSVFQLFWLYFDMQENKSFRFSFWCCCFFSAGMPTAASACLFLLRSMCASMLHCAHHARNQQLSLCIYYTV